MVPLRVVELALRAAENLSTRGHLFDSINPTPDSSIVFEFANASGAPVILEVFEDEIVVVTKGSLQSLCVIPASEIELLKTER